MNCPLCGKENSDDARECQSCKATLTNPSGNPVTVKVYWLAITAIILAFCGLILQIPFLMTVINPQIRRSVPVQTFAILSFTGFLTLGGAITLGLISYIKIEISGGKTTGGNFAIVAVIISILACIVLPGWSMFYYRPRSVAFRMVCGTNLSGIGKAMMLYANDYEDQFPRAGGKETIWANQIPDWKAPNRYLAYGIAPDGSGGNATISSSLYLLVRYMEVEPKKFICIQDPKTEEFIPRKYGIRDLDISQLWDFGPEPWKHTSYSYHMPYGQYALTTSSDPGLAVAADRNPWIVSPAGKAKDFKLFDPDGETNDIIAGNSPSHQGDSQNVLFVDNHVGQEKTSACGANDDNIYTSWDGDDIRRGTVPKPGSQPADKLDSLLLNDPPIKKP